MMKRKFEGPRRAKESNTYRSSRKSSRFTPYFLKPEANHIETDEKEQSSRPGRCFDGEARGHWSRDYPKKEENKIGENFLQSCFWAKMFEVDEHFTSVTMQVGR